MKALLQTIRLKNTLGDNPVEVTEQQMDKLVKRFGSFINVLGNHQYGCSKTHGWAIIDDIQVICRKYYYERETKE